MKLFLVSLAVFLLVACFPPYQAQAGGLKLIPVPDTETFTIPAVYARSLSKEDPKTRVGIAYCSSPLARLNWNTTFVADFGAACGIVVNTVKDEAAPAAMVGLDVVKYKLLHAGVALDFFDDFIGKPFKNSVSVWGAISIPLP